MENIEQTFQFVYNYYTCFNKHGQCLYDYIFLLDTSFFSPRLDFYRNVCAASAVTYNTFERDQKQQWYLASATSGNLEWTIGRHLWLCVQNFLSFWKCFFKEKTAYSSFRKYMKIYFRSKCSISLKATVYSFQSNIELQRK